MGNNHKITFNKHVANRIFLDAFKKAGIEIQESRFITKKPYEILAAEIIKANDLSPLEHPNLANYIKDRFNKLKKDLTIQSVEHVTYISNPFNFIKSYALGEGLRQKIDDVLYRKKPFHYLNFWRMPKEGQLFRSKNRLIFVCENKTVLNQISEIKPYRMSRDKEAYWVKLTYLENNRKKNVYLMPELYKNRPQSCKVLIQKLDNFIKQAKPNDTE